MQNRFLGAVLALVAGAIAAPAPKPATCDVTVKVSGRLVGVDSAAIRFGKDQVHPIVGALKDSAWQSTMRLQPGSNYLLLCEFPSPGSVRSFLVTIETPRGKEFIGGRGADARLSEQSLGGGSFRLLPDCSLD